MKFVGVFVSVLLVAVVQLYAAGPMGLALDLSRHWTALAVYLGGMTGVVAFVVFGDRLVHGVRSLLRWLLRRPPAEPTDEDEEAEETPSRFARLVDRFGAPFLGLAGPITIGGWAAAVLGTSNGVGKLRMIFWLGVGQAIVTVAYVYSLAELTD